jgi:outer membrane protein TolC
VAAARLAEVLGVREGLFLEPQEPTVITIKLVPPAVALPELVTTALNNRPELAESRFLVNAAVDALRREKFAPLLPSVALGASQTGFGGAPGDDVQNFHGRFDFDAIIYWELRNLGFGEAAARAQMAARTRQARAHELQVMDRVAREVGEDYARMQARLRQIEFAKSGIPPAEQSFQLNLGRIKGAAGIPLEVLQSIQALDQSRREYLRAVTEYDRAQFRLYRDLGWPIKN